MSDNLNEKIASLPLSGVNMIEANAGTGKTFNIVLLYLRAVVEKALYPEQILTVTFTKDATKELKSRVLVGLNKLKSFIKSVDIADDGLSAKFEILASEWKKKGISNELIEQRLDMAIREFYKASVFTIHGLCQLLQQKLALEIQAPLRFELLEDSIELRTIAAERAVIEVLLELEKKGFSEKWRTTFTEVIDLKLIQKALANLEGVKSVGVPVLHPSPKAFDDFLAQRSTSTPHFLDLLPPKKEVMAEFNEHINGLVNANSVKEKSIHDLYLKMNTPDVDFFNGCLKKDVYCYHKICDKKKKTAKREIPALADLSAHTQLENALDSTEPNAVLSINSSIIKRAYKIYTSLKAEHSVLVYDDLIAKLAEAIREPQTEKVLAERVKKSYKLFFIDEFQDTDELQIEIFGKLFVENEIPVFTLGDPKQSIYRFRGADLESYVKANRQWKATEFGLNENYRSSERMLNATNTLFDSAGSFLHRDIQLTPSTYPQNNEPMHIDVGLLDESVIQILKGNATADDFKQEAANHIAEQIHYLIGRKTKKGEEENELKASDFAILCSSNNDCANIKQYLKSSGIDSLIVGTQDIFDTPIAADLYLLLYAVYHYRSRKVFNSILNNPLLGMSLQDIEGERESVFQKINEIFKAWQKYGFKSCIDALEQGFNVQLQLTQYAEPERALTDFNHLIQYLHEDEASKGLSIQALLHHFNALISDAKESDTKAVESRQQRLESDENLVRIMTFHRSKGLEFSVVFCPTISLSVSAPTKYPYMINYDQRDHLVLYKDQTYDDISWSELYKEQDEKELIRKYYVAFTRAKHRLYLYQNNNPKIKSKALNSLEELNGFNWTKENGFNKGFLDSNCKTSSDELGSKEIKSTKTLIQPKKLQRTVFPAWLKSSFSGIKAGSEQIEANRSGLDLELELQQDEPTKRGSDSYKPQPGAEFKGAWFGDIVHNLLERVDFRLARTNPIEFNHQIRSELSLPEFAPPKKSVKGEKQEEEFKKFVCELISSCLNKPLVGGRSLSDFEETDLVKEEAFYFSMKTDCFLTMLHQLKDYYPELTSLDLSYLQKHQEVHLNGFIDLLVKSDDRWYIIDYKTNFLPNYKEEVVLDAMQEAYYRLQYLIYLAAWLKYQHLFIADISQIKQHLGGSIYLFMRAINNETNEGVYQDEISDQVYNVIVDHLF